MQSLIPIFGIKHSSYIGMRGCLFQFNNNNNNNNNNNYKVLLRQYPGKESGSAAHLVQELDNLTVKLQYKIHQHILVQFALASK